MSYTLADLSLRSRCAVAAHEFHRLQWSFRLIHDCRVDIQETGVWTTPLSIGAPLRAIAVRFSTQTDSHRKSIAVSATGLYLRHACNFGTYTPDADSRTTVASTWRRTYLDCIWKPWTSVERKSYELGYVAVSGVGTTVSEPCLQFTQLNTVHTSRTALTAAPS